MEAKTVIQQTISFANMLIHSYLGDMTDEEMRMEAVSGMNPVAWQVGHLIVTERGAMEGIQPGSCPALPEGFEAAHPRQPSEADPSRYSSKEEYIKLWNTQHKATWALLESLDDAALSAPSPERMKEMAPTVGAVINMMGGHTLMHVGQFVAARRKSGKKIAF